MLITCPSNCQHLLLSSNLYEDTPLILALEPFNEERNIELLLDKTSQSKIFTSHINDHSVTTTTPSYCSSFVELHRNSVFLLFKEQQLWTAVLCLSHSGLITSITPGSHNSIILRAKSLSPHPENTPRTALVAMKGQNLSILLDKLFSTAISSTQSVGRLYKDKPMYSPWLNKLGWESRTAYGDTITHDKVMESVWSLKRAEFLPSYVLINSGWQQLAFHLQNEEALPSLLSFEADKVKFPKGLSGLITDLQNAGVEHIGIGHSMMGAPGGIHPSLAKEYNLKPDHKGSYFLGDDLGKTFQFYYDYYFYLREQGVTFVEVYDQASPYRLERECLDTTILYHNLQVSMQSSACFHFNSTLLQRACIRNENILQWSKSNLAYSGYDIDQGCTSNTMRSIRNILTNSLWLQKLIEPHIGSWPTDTPHSEILAMLAALSGSLNICADKPTKHNTTLLSKSVLPSGDIIKADKTITLCEDSIFIDPIKGKTLYKAHTKQGENLLILAMNLSHRGKGAIAGKVSPQDTGQVLYEQYAAFSYRNGFLGTIEKDQTVNIKVKNSQADIITFTPIKEGLAILGCYLYFIPSATIKDINLTEESLHITTKVTAPLLIYSQRHILEVRKDGHAIPWGYDEQRQILSVDARCHTEDQPTTYNIFFE